MVENKVLVQPRTLIGIYSTAARASSVCCPDGVGYKIRGAVQSNRKTLKNSVTKLQEHMRSRRSSIAIALGLLVAFVAWAAPSMAQPWPQRTVKLIVPLGPGSGVDIGARLFADRLTARWGQPVVVENRPGGDGIVAINAFVGAH